MKIKYEMGAIASYEKHYDFGYFGWPSVTKLEDGTLVAGVSGLRRHHLCNNGKVLIYYGSKDGLNWSCPRIIEDSEIDDRDTGVVCIGGNNILVSWFTGQHYTIRWKNDEATTKAVSFWSKEKFDYYNGSYIKTTSDNGKSFSEKIKVDVTAPHGPMVLNNGDLVYLGNVFPNPNADPIIRAIKSIDNGKTWIKLGDIPYSDDIFEKKSYHEPHIIEIRENEFLAVIRDQSIYENGKKAFRVIFSKSFDGGVSWSKPKPLGIDGSPPHLMRHSSGAIICTYGFRAYDYIAGNKDGSGERAIISYDNGETWSKPYMISDHIENGDLGYPCTIELNDGSLFTVYYQRESNKHHPGLLYSKWELPKVK